ncbi:hypothetical protein PTTG_29500 [Puccinia triticina 1-1 BBBD Race 1]|uniref:Uncharacterized protein n=1 Tax=Puccinia triticina (isolate 1-1 / race 1 (BBBD)) TaxID=630390 RepID=A0A180G3M0_PUCT1|nr:hypothetical protein PTTG_29500 [Puccinia triticina 1-1 BBBD Race 1]
MFLFYSLEGNLFACYISKLRGCLTIIPTHYSSHSVPEGSTFSSIAPSLAEFGKDLVIGETYVINGHASEDTDGHFVWEFNPLIASSRIPVVCPYILNRIVVTGRGPIRNVIEHTNGVPEVIVVHEIVVFIRFEGADIGTVVRVFVRPDDAPCEVVGTFIPGSYVHFRGYLCCTEKVEDTIDVEGREHKPSRRQTPMTVTRDANVEELITLSPNLARREFELLTINRS